MLGSGLCRALRYRYDVWGAVRGSPAVVEKYDLLPTRRIFGGVDVLDFARVERVVNECHPDVVINATGVIKQKGGAGMIGVNSTFPRRLAGLCAGRGVRLIHISTDCVFSGRRGNYSENDTTDPVDLYGYSKLLGEVNSPSLTIRTSLVGWELESSYSLLGWLSRQREKRILGFRRAIFSGVSVPVFSNLMGDVLESCHDMTGIYHVASMPISKYDLLVRLRDALGWGNVDIQPDDDFHCDRSLDGRHFALETGWNSPTWDEMIEGLACGYIK